ncbi:MAG: class II fumarate hydratase [Waddliaceae bacterium]
MKKMRLESDSMGEIEVPSDKLWGAQTQRSLHHFSIGSESIPKEMIPVFAILKKACAIVNCSQGRLSAEKRDLIVKVCDEIIEGEHLEHFPLYVWMTGSGTQFNMNVNEVIANRISQIKGEPLGSKKPVHPNDDINMSQSSNDAFPSAMYMTAAIHINKELLPALRSFLKSFEQKSRAWDAIVKIGRTHMQDATPLTLGQEFSGYATMIEENIKRLNEALLETYSLCLGGTAVGTGINTLPGFDVEVAKEIATLTDLPFKTGSNKFALQGSHDAMVHLSGVLKTIAVSLYKIANDIRLLSCGPRAGLNELKIPSNEPGSSIMPGKVNPTQCEALTMAAVQAIANDSAVTIGGASGYLEMNVYKPLMIYNVLQSIQVLSDSMNNFRKFCLDGMEPNLKQIQEYVKNSLMLVTALSPVIGYDKASHVAHFAYEKNLTLKEAALELGFVTEEEFDHVVDPEKMVRPQ